MSERYCDRCGARSSPRMPRTRIGDQMWCDMCTQNHGRQVMAVDELHPDIAEQRRRYGVSHTTGGRFLRVEHTGASHADQEARLANQAGWTHHSTFAPVRNVIEGARAYNAQVGLGDPHTHGYDHVRQDADTTRTVGRLYDNLPERDKAALPHFEAMAHEVGQQYHHLTHTMGIHVESTHEDPYKSVHDMVRDVADNKRLKVLSTAATGGHPFFSNEQNDKFRAVHDAFGHAATGRDFDRHGEQAAYLAHSQMFTPKARPAMASETKGQNTSLILNGHFGPQKVALLPRHHWDDSSLRGADPNIHTGGRTMKRYAVMVDAALHRVGSIKVIAHDSGDGETIFHCPFCGSGQVLARNDGSVDCQFCQTAFTVQVQPQMPAFPQTIDGVPVQVPGMPNGGPDANVPAGGGADPMDPNAPPGAPVPPGAPPGADDGSQPPEDDPDDADGDSAPPWLKKSYRTATGAVLDARHFRQHLALATSTDRARTLARIRAENGSTR